MFDAVNKIIATHKAVALVNEVKITQHDLDISVSQISAGSKLYKDYSAVGEFSDTGGDTHFYTPFKQF